MDESGGAEHALRWCVSVMPGHAERLHIVKAWQIPTAAGAEYGVQFTVDMAPETAYSGLAQLVADLAPAGITVTTDIVQAGASWALLDASDDADLLVLGSRGLGGFKRLMLGSVSHQCATHARIPVAVVPDRTATEGLLRRIVVGIDGSPASAASLSWALRFAPDEAEVVAVGVWSPSMSIGDADDPIALEQAAAAYASIDSTIDQVESSFDVPRRVERVHRVGKPAAKLLDAAEDADLLVVGERGRGAFSAAVLGSVATSVLHHANCPVVVVPAPEGAAADVDRKTS